MANMANEADEYAELVEIIKNASSLMPQSFNRIELSAMTANLEGHMQAIDSMVLEDIYTTSTTLSNIETLTNIYNSLLSEKQSLNDELSKIMKTAMEVQSLDAEVMTERANMVRLVGLLNGEIESKESEYSKLSSGMSEMDLELEKYRMSLMDFMQLPLRQPPDEAISNKVTKIAEERLKETENQEENGS